MSVEEVDSLPWWQYRMYVEELNREMAEKSQGDGSEQESNESQSTDDPNRLPTGQKWKAVGDNALSVEGFAVRSVGT